MTAIHDIDAATLAKSLRTSFVGRSLVAEFELESTNITARELAAADAPEGLVVIADHQTGGMGRNGRKWLSPPEKNLYFSLVLRPDCAPAAVPQLAILSALSIAKALELTDVAVKWPNDVWMNGRKLCGILSTMSCTAERTEYAVIGIGINVNMLEFPEDVPGTSLALETGHLFNRADILARVLNAIEEDYLLWKQSASLEPFMGRWKKHSLLDGREISAEHGRDILYGTACGITDHGLLKLRLEDGSITLVAAGDTHILLK